tara:strand:- start:4520 stop:5161 length:642 start_codon:yes stop_codon:yes gene_type:complete
LIDLPKHKGQRKKLVEKLFSKGIRNKRILNAIYSIPRHFFMESDFDNYAYEDKAFPISASQTISQPYTVAFQTEKLDVKEGEKVLEIGTGSGYQTAILIHLKCEVYSDERIFELSRKSKKILSKLNLNAKKLVWSDGYLGLKDFAPFDKIIVTAASKEIPPELLNQLKINGKMIIPVGEINQTMILIEKKGLNDFKKTDLGLFKFVPMLKNKV